MSRNLKRLYRPPTDLEKYDNEEYSKNPLLKYNICEIKERRHYTFLHRKATNDKVKLCGKPEVDLNPVLPMRQSHYVDKLREYASKIPVPRMLYQTENKILDFVPKRLRDMYPNIVKEYMTEVHGEFDQIIKSYSLRKILVEPEGHSEKTTDRCENERQPHGHVSSSVKRKGKTSNYPNYLRNREKLKRQFVLNHVFVRAILKNFELDFPQVLCDYGMYDLKEKLEKPMLVRKYTRTVTKLLNDKTEFIRRTWYPKLMNILRKNFKKHALTLTQWRKVLKTAKGLINRQFNVVKMRTIEDLIEIVLDRERIPMFTFELMCGPGGIILEPSYKAVQSCFANIIDEIADVGRQLETPELQLDRFSFPTTESELHINLNR